MANGEQTKLTFQRLVADRRISQWRHESGLQYWTGWSSRPQTNLSLVRSLGILLFCQQSESRSLVTKDELETWFPDLFRHGLPAGQYLNRQSTAVRLGHIRVDAGQSKISRLVARTDRLVHKYRQQSGFRQLIDNGQFELTWIVPTLPKQYRLIQALKVIAGSGVHLRVCAIPELLNVIAPIKVG